MVLNTVSLIPWAGSDTGVMAEGVICISVQDTTRHNTENLPVQHMGTAKDSSLLTNKVSRTDSSHAFSAKIGNPLQDSVLALNRYRVHLHKDTVQHTSFPGTLPQYAIKSGAGGMQAYFFPFKAGENDRFWKERQPKNLVMKSLQPSPSNTVLYLANRNNFHPDWFSIILIVSVVMLSWSRKFFGRYFQQSIAGLFDFHLSARLFRDKNILLQRVSSILLLNFVVTSALFVYKSLEYLNPRFFNPSFSSFLVIAGALLLILLFNSFSVHFLNFLFTRSQALLEYYYQVQNFFKSVGVVLIPLVIVYTYLQGGTLAWLLWTGVISISLLYLYRLFKGQRIIQRLEVPVFYLLLYLCILELLPVLVAAKFIKDLA